LVVHLHFHHRTTGITRSIESILPFLLKYTDIKVLGYGINAVKINFTAFIKQAYSRGMLTVHAHRNNEIIFALILRFLGAKFRLVTTRHSETKPSGLTIYLMKKTDVVISLTGSMAKDLPVTSKIVRHGVNTSFFVPGKKKKIKGIPQEKIISVIGRIRSAKGQDIVLRAMAPLLKANPDWGLAIIGKIDDRKYEKELISTAGQNRISTQVHFIPMVKNVLDIYHASDAVVIASASEGFSLVCLEALSCGLVTVATKSIGIHSEVIKDAENGFLYSFGDIENLRSIVSRIINNEVNFSPEEIRQSIVTNWDISKSARELAGIYGI